MNHTTTSIRIIIAAALALSMIIAGTNLGILQQHKGYAASEAQKHEQSTIQSI